jgi:hypothetical protein
MPLKGSREGHPGYFEAMGQSSGRFSGALHGLLHKAASKSGLDPYIDEHVIRRMEWIANASQGTQVLLRMLYRDRVERHLPLPSFDDVEFRVHSQNGEDGILLYLFSILEAPTKRSVEICAGEGFECNTANLIINHGWRGLLVDGDEAKVQRAKDFYVPNRSTSWFPRHVAHAWATAENVDKYLRGYGFDGEIDLLSLDLDGIDYWIWKAMESVSPRVVVAEYNWTWRKTESKRVPYKAHFTNPPRDDASKSAISRALMGVMIRTAWPAHSSTGSPLKQPSSDGDDYPARRRRIALSGTRCNDGCSNSRALGSDSRHAKASPGGGSSIRNFSRSFAGDAVGKYVSGTLHLATA